MSTENRIVNFSMIQSFLVVCMGGLQVFVVRFFFQVSQMPLQPRRWHVLIISRALARVMFDPYAYKQVCNFFYTLAAWVLKIRFAGNGLYNKRWLDAPLSLDTVHMT